MPYTKRKAHYNSASTLIDYILNDEKTDGGLLTSSINCSVALAAQEFKNNNAHWKAKGNRVAYHLIQSFHPDDPITPEQANELGKRMCEELYGDFQCVISTHIDRGHIHNHIAINSVNIKGRKLEDRLANQKEGIYGYKTVSDRLAKEYGCYVLPEQKISIRKNKDYYYEYKAQSWKETIRSDIDMLKARCSNIDELYKELIGWGYDIKNGKHPAIKAIGMKKYARFYKLGVGYNIEELEEYFGSKSEPRDINEIDDIEVNESEFNKSRILKAKESRIAIIITSSVAKNAQYSQYQKTRYEEIKRFYQLKEELETINKLDIFSYKDLNRSIENLRMGIKASNTEIQKFKKENKDILTKAEKAQDFIRLYKAKEYAEYYRSLDKNYKLPVQVEIFLKLQKELGINTIGDAYSIINDARETRLKINEMKSQVADMQKELNKLDTIKEEQLVNSDLFIHNIKFGGNRIDYELSTDNKWCVKLPYTNEYIFIEKSQTTFNHHNQYYTMFLVDDKKYDIYTEEEILKNKETKASEGKKPTAAYQLSGTALEEYVQTQKEEVTRQYSNNKEDIN